MSIFQYSFVQNALLGAILITPLLGLLSTVVVSNRMSFFADSLGHSALTGIAIGTLLGLKFPLISVIIFSLIFAFLIIFLKNRSNASMDSTIGVFSSTAVALGLLLMSRGGNFNKYSNILIGDLLSIKPAELWALGGLIVLTLAVWCIIYNSLTLGALGGEWGLRKRIKPALAELIFTALLAIIVSVSIKWVGLLLINSLLVLPASCARILAKNSRQYVVFSVLIALVCGILGLIASIYLNTSAGATIVLACAVFYFILALFKA